MKNKTSGYRDVPEFKTFHKLSIYLDKIEPFVMADLTKYNDFVPIDLNVKFYEFIQNTPKR